MNEYYQEQTDYISQLKLCKLIDEKELKKEMNLSNVKLYNFDNIKDTVLKNTQEFLARREDIKHIKSVDAFWYDDLGKTIYLIEASEDHTKQEFTEKLKCSLFILCFLTGLTDFNLRKIKNIEYYFYSPKKKDKFAGLVKNKDNKSKIIFNKIGKVILAKKVKSKIDRNEFILLVHSLLREIIKYQV